MKTGHFLGMGKNWAFKLLESEQIYIELKKVLKTGFPVRTDSELPNSLNLPGVSGRASSPERSSDLVDALDKLIRWKINDLGDQKTRKAARSLFGVEPGSKGLNLTKRRERASTASGYEVHHFRKRIEPRILRRLAADLMEDSQSFGQDRSQAPQLIATYRRPLPLPVDVFAWEAVEHEERSLLIWSRTYELRSRLLSVERLISMEASELETQGAALEALVAFATLSIETTSYRSRYGHRLLASDVEVGIDAFPKMGGWSPKILSDQENLLRENCERAGPENLVEELRKTREGSELVEFWCRSLTLGSEQTSNRRRTLNAAIREQS